MFKKYLIAAAIFSFTATSALCAVPIFGSTDSSNTSQEIELTPAANYSAPKYEENIKAQNNYQEYNKVQSDNFKNAIQSLDGAQVTIREQLINYKAKYTDSKMRYDAVATECKQLKKQIKAYEKQLKSIEATKKNIAKNITAQ